MIAATFSALLQGFFSDRLLGQMRASPNTIAGYRDSFRLLLRYAADRLRKQPSDLTIEDLDARFVIDFLDFVEKKRENTARTRNNRLAAIRSFFRYVAMNEPAHALRCQRILAIPAKRHQKRTIEFLCREEVEALVAAPDSSMWIGRRDRTILLILVQCGLRVSELTSLRGDSVVIGTGAHVRCEGKGRKCRCTPLRREVRSAVAAWLDEQRPAPEDSLFPSSRGGRLSTDAAQRLVAKYASAAGRACPSIAEKKVTPHVLRHSAAMALLEQGVDRSVIALWLGHESVETTQMYLHADLRLKERALARTSCIEGQPGRYQPGDALLAYLDSL
jgi:integrase/recombinase XerD